MPKYKLSDRILSVAKKLVLINLLGGVCEMCGENRHQCLTFHHIDRNKKVNVVNKIYRFSKMLIEIDNCELLCYNCHQKLHKQDTIHSKIRNMNKKIILEYKGVIYCNVCNKLLDMDNYHCHHLRDKKYIISKRINNLKMNNIYDIPLDLKLELDKCIPLCPNCHQDIHFDRKFFLEYYDRILDKSKNLKERNEKFDVDYIKDEYNKGRNQISIAKELGAAKSTICGIIKSLGLQEAKPDIIKLYENYKDIKYITKNYNVKRRNVIETLNRNNIEWKTDINKRKYISKFNITKEELQKLLLQNNFTQIGKLYNVTYVAVSKKAKKFGLI